MFGSSRDDRLVAKDIAYVSICARSRRDLRALAVGSAVELAGVCRHVSVFVLSAFHPSPDAMVCPTKQPST